jgi:hypothetical protein
MTMSPNDGRVRVDLCCSGGASVAVSRDLLRLLTTGAAGSDDAALFWCPLFDANGLPFHRHKHQRRCCMSMEETVWTG